MVREAKWTGGHSGSGSCRETRPLSAGSITSTPQPPRATCCYGEPFPTEASLIHRYGTKVINGKQQTMCGLTACQSLPGIKHERWGEDGVPWCPVCGAVMGIVG